MSPLTQVMQIALDLSSKNDTLLVERNGAIDALEEAWQRINTLTVELSQAREALTAEQSAHAATRQAWKEDKDFRAATAPKNGATRHVLPPTEEMEA